MVIFHSYVSLPEGTYGSEYSQIQKYHRYSRFFVTTCVFTSHENPQCVHQYQGGQWDVITMASSWCPSMWPLCQIVIKLPTTSEKNTPEMDEETTFFQANHPVSRDGTICIYVHLRIYIYTHAYGNIWKYMEVHIYIYIICMYVCLCVYYIMLYTHVHRF